jgi:nuclear migration protein JNM1
MESELKAWREGLEKVEQAVGEASEANGRNGKVVEAWVRELEGRMKKLGR